MQNPASTPFGDDQSLETDDNPLRLLGTIDDAINGVFERYRGKRGPDKVAALVSILSDYGLIWLVVALTKGLRGGPHRWRAIRNLATAGILSWGINKLAKKLVGRSRPEESLRLEVTSDLPVRNPTSSSFPSGHTLAAFCAGAMMADSPAETAIFTTFALAVSASRVH